MGGIYTTPMRRRTTWQRREIRPLAAASSKIVPGTEKELEGYEATIPYCESPSRDA